MNKERKVFLSSDSIGEFRPAVRDVNERNLKFLVRHCCGKLSLRIMFVTFFFFFVRFKFSVTDIQRQEICRVLCYLKYLAVQSLGQSKF